MNYNGCRLLRIAIHLQSLCSRRRRATVLLLIQKLRENNEEAGYSLDDCEGCYYLSPTTPRVINSFEFLPATSTMICSYFSFKAFNVWVKLSNFSINVILGIIPAVSHSACYFADVCCIYSASAPLMILRAF